MFDGYVKDMCSNRPSRGIEGAGKGRGMESSPRDHLMYSGQHRVEDKDHN